MIDFRYRAAAKERLLKDCSIGSLVSGTPDEGVSFSVIEESFVHGNRKAGGDFAKQKTRLEDSFSVDSRGKGVFEGIVLYGLLTLAHRVHLRVVDALSYAATVKCSTPNPDGFFTRSPHNTSHKN